MKAKYIILIAVIVGILGIIVLVAAVTLITQLSRFVPVDVALIRVEGVITSGEAGGGFFDAGSGGAEHVVKLLERFRKDRSVRSLVLRINSPGGSPAGAEEIYKEIRRIREGKDGKKVFVSMADVAASAAYYIASPADRIYANASTLTGSIGVISESADVHELLDKLGVKFEVVKSGRLKDMGSFSRPMTPQERRLLQAMTDDVYDQLITDVSVGRRMPKEQVRKLADGRIYTGRQALRLKLIDEVGSLEDALRAAARASGIKGRFRVKTYDDRIGLLHLLVGGQPSRISLPRSKPNPLMDLAQKLLQADPRGINLGK